jgi:hypothetical protein
MPTWRRKGFVVVVRLNLLDLVLRWGRWWWRLLLDELSTIPEQMT